MNKEQDLPLSDGGKQIWDAVERVLTGPVATEWEDYIAPDGKEWRVARWELMRAEMPGMAVEHLPGLHAALIAPANERAWFIAMHLFGMMTVIRALDSDPEEARPWSRAEICGKLGISDKELVAELQALRMGWERMVKSEKFQVQSSNGQVATGKTHLTPPHPQPLSNPIGEGSVGLSPHPMGGEGERRREDTRALPAVEDDALLRRFGWDPKIFNVAGRDAVMSRDEKAWFAEQVRGWQKLLTNVKTSSPARQALNNALRLRREENASWDLDAQKPPEDAKKRAEFEKAKDMIARRIAECQEAHEKSLQILHEMAPGFGIDRSELPTTGAIGEIIKGVQDWEARGDKRLIDGVYNQHEIQFLMRTSLQMPLPQYRAGKVAFIVDSMSWMWNREAKSKFKENDFLILDMAFREAIRALKEKRNMHVPDLRMDGPEGEYEDMHVADEVLK